MENELRLRKYRNHYKAGHNLFEEGDTGDEFYIIREGTVKISKEEEGDKVNIATVGSGEILGEMALIGDTSERTATATAETAVTCLEFPEDQLDKLLEKNSRFREVVVKLLCERIDKTTERLSTFQQREFQFHKTAQLLLNMIEENDWYDDATKEIELSPEETAALKKFDFSPGELKQFLEVKSESEHYQLEPEDQEKLLDLSFQVLENCLENIEIN